MRNSTDNDLNDLTTLQDVLAYLVSWRVGDFYARLVANLPSRPEKKVPFMGVCWERGHHVLLYNEDWVQQKLEEGRKGMDELRATVAHEAFHVILCHIARQMKLFRSFTADKEKARFLQRSNTATDMAVNDLLRSERDGRGMGPTYVDLQRNAKMWVLPEHMKFPSELTYEWYLSLMMDKDICPECVIRIVRAQKKAEDDDGDGDGNKNKGQTGGKCTHGPRGDAECPNGKHTGAHEFWVEMSENLSDEEMEMVATQVEADAYEKVKQAVEEHKRDRGTVPGFVEETLDNMMKPPRVPWKKLLHQYVQRCRLSKPMRTLERPRRRWAMLDTTLYPGLKRDRTFRLGFGIDTSGSMSSDDIHEGLVELQGIAKLDKDIEIVVVEFDTMIHKEYVLDAHGEVDVKVVGRGGTDFNAFFQRMFELGKKSEIDAIICFTDGYAPAPELKFRPIQIPTLWCLVEQGQHPCPDFGIEIRRPRG
jgi:predicted metal-dependent peptidase